MRRHGMVARRRRVIAEIAVVRAMFAAKVHRIAREGGLVRLEETGQVFRAVRVGPYESRLLEI